MKKLRKMFVLMGTVTLMVNFCSFNILAEDGIKQVSEVQTINPRSGNVYYKYKIINGKKYKRLWSADKNAWVDPILDISIGCNEIGVVKEVKYASLTMPFYVIKGDNYVRKKTDWNKEKM